MKNNNVKIIFYLTFTHIIWNYNINIKGIIFPKLLRNYLKKENKLVREKNN